MAKLSQLQTYCGTCKHWKNTSRKINVWGQVYIPDTSLTGHCSNEASSKQDTTHKQTCRYHQPLEISAKLK